MNRITTRPAPARPAAPADPSPLLSRIHLLLTTLLFLGLATIGGMAAAGFVHFGNPAGPAIEEKAPEKQDGQSAAKDSEKGGRYQIEVADDTRQMMNEVGKIGILGERVREAWVFRYKGGFVTCKLESDFGKPLTSPFVPHDWSNFLGGDEDVQKANPEALNKEGYIILLSMASGLPPDEELVPLHPHLGASFTIGPAGPLHGLIPFYHEVWRRREYRLFISSGPPKDLPGRGFNVATRHPLLIRSHIIRDDANPDTEPGRTAGGKNLEAGKDLTILERQRGLTTIKLTARFLTDQEAVEKSKKTPKEE